MNNLSWFIYFIGVADNLVQAIQVVLVFGFIAVSFAGVGVMIAEEGWLLPYVKKGSIGLAVLSLVLVIVPDRKTMLLIAGSEIGDRALQSGAMNDVVNPGMDLLKSWIKKETDKIKKDS